MVDAEVMKKSAVPKSTTQQILDTAQKFVRSRGYSAFSYADISEEVGIRKASIHYHFPTKTELVRHLVRRYRDTMLGTCDRIAQSSSTAPQQLRDFVALYRCGLGEGQLCLCAMLMADLAVLPPEIQAELQRYVQAVEAWLSDLLQRGYALDPTLGDLESKGLLALLHGAQLRVRIQADSPEAFDLLINPWLDRQFPGP